MSLFAPATDIKTCLQEAFPGASDDYIDQLYKTLGSMSMDENSLLKLIAASSIAGGLQPDLHDNVQIVSVTLGLATQTRVELPAGTRGVRLSTALTDVFFSIDQDPVTAAPTSATNPVVEGDFGFGNFLPANSPEVRLIPSNAEYLHLYSATGGSVLIETF